MTNKTEKYIYPKNQLYQCLKLLLEIELTDKQGDFIVIFNVIVTERLKIYDVAFYPYFKAL